MAACGAFGRADDSALRECDESCGTRYSERHSAQIDASGQPDLAQSLASL
jgi:hypothetical protein